MDWIEIIENSALTIVALIVGAGLVIRAIRQERQKIKDTIRPVVKEEIRPVETKVDTLLISDKFQLFFEEAILPALILDTSTGKILSANVAFCKMVKQDKATVEKERFLKYVDPNGIEDARKILETMRDGGDVKGKKINFASNIISEIYATGNGSVYLSLVPDIKT